MPAGENQVRTCCKHVVRMWKVNWSTWHERGTKKQIRVPDRNWTHGLNTGWVLHPLSYENSARSFNWVHHSLSHIHVVLINFFHILLRNSKFNIFIHLSCGQNGRLREKFIFQCDLQIENLIIRLFIFGKTTFLLQIVVLHLQKISAGQEIHVSIVTPGTQVVRVTVFGYLLFHFYVTLMCLLF